ncbi:MAG: DUF2066 domain-containing protein [Immundisolibacteraceae bacterium]|nr:DUF2066 domain-containing protein [Immundisolibacteraceae bacterium]
MRFKKTAIHSLLALCAIIALPSVADIQTRDLFHSEVTVDSQRQRDLKQALPHAFGQVLIKLTANPAIIEQPWAAEALRKSENYVLQYRYESRTEKILAETDLKQLDKQPDTQFDQQHALPETSAANLALTADRPSEPTIPEPTTVDVLYLICEFNEQAVTQLFEEFGIAYWGRSRPTLVSWLLHEDSQQRQIINSEAPLYATQLPDIASSYGLNLVLPLMDLQEQAEVTISHLWLRDTRLLKHASKRYSEDGYLLAQVSTSENGQWSGEWLLSINNQEYQWPMQHAADLESLLRQGVSTISSQLFSLYSHRPLNIHSTSEIHIGNITGMGHYQQVWDYLRQLRGVQHVMPLNFNADKTTFTVEHSGDWSELTRLIELDGTLSTKPQVNPGQGQSGNSGVDLALPTINSKQPMSTPTDYGSTDGHLFSQPKQRYYSAATVSTAVPLYHLTQ